MKGKERKRKEKWREGGGVCTSGVEGKGRRKREMGGEGRVLYEGLKGKGEEERERGSRKDEMDEDVRGWVWVKEMDAGEGTCKKLIGFGGFVEREKKII